MIKATDLIKKVDTFKVDNENYTNLTDACKHAAYIALGLNKKSVPPAINAINRINKLAARFEREFLRTSIGCREEDVFYFELFLQFEPTLKEVIRAFREDVTFYGRVNINSINEIKKDFKENYKRVSDIREIFNKGYGAYLIKASFSRGDFEEPSYWDLEVISHYKF